MKSPGEPAGRSGSAGHEQEQLCLLSMGHCGQGVCLFLLEWHVR